MTKLNLAELDRLEREAKARPTDYRANTLLSCAIYWQLRPLLDLVGRLGQVVAYRGCVRRGPGGHYNSVRCLDQGAPDHGSNEYGNRPLAEEVWCDGCRALADYQRAKENTTECEKCNGTGDRYVAGEPVTSEFCGECSGEGVV